jgi:hemerythrin-like domain-containing protein
MVCDRKRGDMAHQFVQHLLKDHEEQRNLGKELRNAKQPEQREKLRQQFYEAVYPHMVGEEASIFDWMQSAGDHTREEALKAVQEHHVAKMVLAELMDLSLDGDTFLAKAYVLDELNRHHMDEEEKTHFPIMERMLPDQRIDELFEQYEQAEQETESG